MRAKNVGNPLLVTVTLIEGSSGDVKLQEVLIAVGAVPAIRFCWAAAFACKSAKPVLPLQTKPWFAPEDGSPSWPDVKPEVTKALAPAKAPASAAFWASPEAV